MKRENKPNNLKPSLLNIGIGLSLILVLGSILTSAIVKYGEKQARLRLLDVATTAVTGLSTTDVSSLTGSLSDIDEEDYERVRNQLVRIRRANPRTRFVYLMGQKNNQVVFLADAEPSDSEDYSAPGDPYDEASPELLEAFENGEPFTEGPFTDAWGEWVSGHAVIRNTQTGSVIALLGMDVDAQAWRSHIAIYMWFGICLTLFTILLTLLFLLDLRRVRKGNVLLKREIKVRQLAEESLQVEKDTAQKYLDTAGAILLVIDKNKTVKLINRRGCEVLGYDESEIVGKNMFDRFIPEKDRERTYEEFERICSGQVGSLEYYENAILTRSGEEKTIAWHNTVVRDENQNITAILSSGEDVTYRRKTEEAVERILEKGSSKVGGQFFQAMVNEVAEILEADYTLIGEFPEKDNSTLRTLAVYADGRKAEGFEYDLEKFPCGNNSNQGICSYPEGVPQAFPNNLFLKDMEIEGWVSVSLYDSQNRKTGLMAALFRKPIHDLRLAETILNIFASRTASEIERKRDEEIRHRIETQLSNMWKMESLNVMAGSIAHNFNNILQVILGNHDLILQDLPDDSPHGALLKNAQESACRAAELSTLMLSYVGQGVSQTQKANLSHVVRDMEPSLKDTLSSNQTIQMRLSENMFEIEADPDGIRDITRQVVSNSVEALAQKPGSISIITGIMECDREYFQQTSLFEGQADGVYAYLEVSDTGCGMDEEIRRRMFDPFFTTKFLGRGLGMASVLGIVRQHKGAISIFSEPDFGTTIRILLPVSERRARNQSMEIEGVRRNIKERRLDRKLETWAVDGKILLIDDDKTVRAVVKEMLQRQGFTVLTARDGFEGIEEFRKSSEDVCCILLDKSMPRMDGLEAIEKLREIREDVPVIIASGSNVQRVQRLFVDKDVAGYIQKPYQTTDLRKKLHEVLGRVQYIKRDAEEHKSDNIFVSSN